MFLRTVYIVFVGIIIAAFVGVGILAFYPEPKAPEAPLSVKYPQNIQIQDVVVLNQIRDEQTNYDNALKAYLTQEQLYNRNVSIISITLAVLTLAISLTLLQKILVFADGSVLGGVLTLLYGIMRGFGTDDNQFRFVVVLIGMVISLALGYLKFIRQTLPEKGYSTPTYTAGLR